MQDIIGNRLCDMIEEQLLIHQLKQGKDAAYRLLYEKHYAVLCHLAREWVGDDYTAESLVGDVIFYLLQAVRNRCLDYLASRRERTEVAFSALEEEEDGRQPLAERYIQSDDYPLGRLLERELEPVGRLSAGPPAGAGTGV